MPHGKRHIISSSDEDSDGDLQHGYNERQTTQQNLQPITRRDVPKNGFGTMMFVMNRLYDVFTRFKLEGKEDINLPRIVVCGSQSSGKTSVLESIVGEEFLPRGTGIQTRCPIILQLVHTPGNSKWIEFAHKPGTRYEDFQKAKNNLKNLSSKIQKSGEVVSSTPITVKIFSPNVVDLTLVDLPGLIENSVEGQPANLVEKISELVYKYIKNPNSIILAVSQATTDIADSKCIRLAKEVDPAGVRTLGVLTKLDMMDEGTDARDVLTGQLLRLKLGIIGVVNRSFKDTKENKSVAEGLEKEKLFLKKNYPDIGDQNGIPFLISKTSILLFEKIAEALPNVKAKVDEIISKSFTRLESLGGSKGAGDKRKVIIRQINKFSKKYIGQVDGRSRDLSTTEKSSSAKIKEIFDDWFENKMMNLTLDKLTDESIYNAILNSRGLHNLQWDSDDAFQELAKRGIRKMKSPVTECLKRVHDEMLATVQACLDPDTNTKYPKLNNNISLVTCNLISRQHESCATYLKDYLTAEASFAKTSKPEFLRKLYSMGKNKKRSKKISEDEEDEDSEDEDSGSDGSDTDSDEDESDESDERSKSKKNKTKSKLNPNENNNIKRDEVRDLIKCYFDLTKVDIKDHTPKAIATKLVYGVVDDLNEELTLKLVTAENITGVMDESDDFVKERELIQKKINDYREAKTIIDEILQTTSI